MGRYVPELHFLSILLGDEPVLSPYVQYYQRLLSTDQSEARHVLELYLKEKPVEELYSAVVIPALGLAEQDRHRNVLDQETQTFIYQSTRDIVEELDDRPAQTANETTEENATVASTSSFFRLETKPTVSSLCFFAACWFARSKMRKALPSANCQKCCLRFPPLTPASSAFQPCRHLR